MVILLEGSPISTEELWSTVSDHWVLGHLPYQGPSPRISQLGRAASSRKSLDSYKLPPVRNDGGHCSWGPSMLQKCFSTLPQICALTQSCLVFALTCTVNCGTLYRCLSKSCPIIVIYHRRTPSCRNISRTHLSSI